MRFTCPQCRTTREQPRPGDLVVCECGELTVASLSDGEIVELVVRLVSETTPRGGRCGAGERGAP